MKRRTFIKQSSLTAASLSILGATQLNGESMYSNKILNVNGQRIESRIQELANLEEMKTVMAIGLLIPKVMLKAGLGLSS